MNIYQQKFSNVMAAASQNRSSKGVYLQDNRAQALQKKVNPTASLSTEPVQLVSYTDLWSNQLKIYQPDKVGSARIPGDAEWLAIRRYCKDVTPDAKDTVNDVLAKAEKIKGVSYHDWKGSQQNGDSQEAQHLISASYATKVLKLPYSYINSPENGKMLLAGRKGKGDKVPLKYSNAKKSRGKTPNRGLKHIKRGIAHPRYEKSLRNYVNSFYLSQSLKIGQKITMAQFNALTSHLRIKHKQYDRNNPNDHGVDDLNL